jgi:hypothetical protein
MATLDPKVKTALTNAGVKLTPRREALLADAGQKLSIDWQKWLQLLTKYGPQVIALILAILSGDNPPTPPTPAMQAKAGAKCPHDCWCEAFDSAMQTVELIAQQCCDCCE